MTRSSRRLPSNLPDLIEGHVYLGQTGQFKVPGGPGHTFSGAASVGGGNWMLSMWRGDGGALYHYTAPANSEIARLNGLGGPGTRFQKRAAALARVFQAVSEGADLCQRSRSMLRWLQVQEGDLMFDPFDPDSHFKAVRTNQTKAMIVATTEETHEET